MKSTENLAEVLKLERIEKNLFRGVSPDDGFPRIFGGLVIAQALLAAYETVPDRVCHSLHAYFIRPGDVTIPVVYEVDFARDGGSFTTRRVTAIQRGEQIFNLAASFQRPEDGYEHQAVMPSEVDPEVLPTEREMIAKLGDKLPAALVAAAEKPRPIDMRWVDPQSPLKPTKKAPQKAVWMRAKRKIEASVKMQQAALAYASDLSFMETALRPHGLVFTTPGLQAASLDHAMWFHRSFDFNDWVLFDQDSPSASQGRGLVRGQMFSRDGVLIASTAQECLMRVKPKA